MSRNPLRRLQAPRPGPPPGSLAAGVIRLAFFNASGFAAIANTVQAYLSSLAPLVAFLVVGAVVQGQALGWRVGAASGLQTLCVLLGQAVLSQLMAAWLGRGALWPRYAAAMNWCQMVIPVVGLLFVLLLLFAGTVGPSPRSVLYGAVAGVGVYALLLNVFLAWRGLDLSLPRALLLVVAVTLGLAALLAVPMLAMRATGGTPAATGAGLPV